MIDFGKRDIENGHYQRAQYHEKRSDPLIARREFWTTGRASLPHQERHRVLFFDWLRI
jgi:hypothetical protein